MLDIYEKNCAYCHTSVSVFESLTEYGKHYHQHCYIHKTHKEIDGYRKKWLGGKLTPEDKVDIIDKYTLVRKLESEKTEFKGFVKVSEKEVHTPLKEEKRVLTINRIPVTDQQGNSVFISDSTPTVSTCYSRIRPCVVVEKIPAKQKKLSAEEILRLYAGGFE